MLEGCNPVIICYQDEMLYQKQDLLSNCYKV